MTGGFPVGFIFAADNSVVINEIAWMGTKTSYNDEWIELYNNTDLPISLDGWLLRAVDKSPEINLAGEISANGFFLLERTDDKTIPNIPADLIYKGVLNNKGENLEFYDSSGILIDSVDCSVQWFGGNNGIKQTMERINPQLAGNNPENWQTSVESNGTPKVQNSKITETKITENRSLPTEPVDRDTEDVAIEVKPQQPEPQQPESPVFSPEALPKFQDQNQLAAISENLPLNQDNNKNGLKIFLIASALAVFSGTIILLLKKKIKRVI